MHEILVNRLYFPLDALHISDYIRPSSGASSCHVAVATQQPDVSACTKCDVELIKVAPDDGLTYSETCRTYNEIKSNHKTSVHLVGLYTYCKMIHGAYNVKLIIRFYGDFGRSYH